MRSLDRRSPGPDDRVCQNRKSAHSPQKFHPRMGMGQDEHPRLVCVVHFEAVDGERRGNTNGQIRVFPVIRLFYCDLIFDRYSMFQSFSYGNREIMLYIWNSCGSFRRKVLPLRLHFFLEIWKSESG
jgi:hypothetical protein